MLHLPLFIELLCLVCTFVVCISLSLFLSLLLSHSLSLSLSLSLSVCLSVFPSEGTMVDEHIVWLSGCTSLYMCVCLYIVYTYPCAVPSLHKDVTCLLTYWPWLLEAEHTTLFNLLLHLSPYSSVVYLSPIPQISCTILCVLKVLN